MATLLFYYLWKFSSVEFPLSISPLASRFGVPSVLKNHCDLKPQRQCMANNILNTILSPP